MLVIEFDPNYASRSFFKAEALGFACESGLLAPRETHSRQPIQVLFAQRMRSYP
jgi:hypothetical protein